MQSANISGDLPSEICSKPLALVGLSGLDVVNNALHKTIWELFSTSRRLERAAVAYKLIGNAHTFPVIKPKRSSYDWYIPKGILKRNWMNKHLNEIPSVLAIFYELDWNDSLWSERMIECTSKVQSIRAALEGRHTQIVVVLIQSSAPLPPGEDMLASERAISLCGSCDLSSTSLFVFPYGDHSEGYAVRLENAFSELAQNYYHNEAKVVRSHKDQLNKSIHQYLYVRHQFKIGFLHELKQDSITAHRHYTHAYNNLLEIRVADTNSLEICTVAGFINYKLCRLLFTLNLPRDAISHFKEHMERFKFKSGHQELTFEHYAWISKQFALFGDIFDEAVKLGLPAVQTQHPGIYYEQAAQYAVARKKISQKLCSNVVCYPSPDPLENEKFMEYYGQRPWRPGKISSDTLDPQLEFNGIQALQYLESQVNQSNIIIGLYGLAISQFKIYRCPRTRKHLILQMADEYYFSQDYGKALTLLTHMLWEFRVEKFWGLMSTILEKALRCAFLIANVQDYVLLSLEVLNKYTLVPSGNKKRVYDNFQRVLKKEIPFGDSEISQDMLQKATINWQSALSSSPKLKLSLDMTNIFSCIETKARFIDKHYEVDQKVIVEVFVRSTCPLSISLSKIAITINCSSSTLEKIVRSVDVSAEFKTDEAKKFVIEFYPETDYILKDIEISNVILEISNVDSSIEMTFSPDNNKEICPELLHFKLNTGQLDFDNVKVLTTAAVVPRSSKLNILFVHEQPALLEEWYEIKINIENKECFFIRNLEIDVNLVEEEVLISTELSAKSPGVSQTIPLKLDVANSLECDAKAESVLYLKAHKTQVKNVQFKITYVLDSAKPVISTKTETILVPVVQPFNITTTFLSTLMNPIDKFFMGEEFGIVPAIECLSPWPIIIEDTSLELDSSIENLGNNINTLKGKTLKQNEVGTEILLAVCRNYSEQNLNIGEYTIKWRREKGSCGVSKRAISGFPCENIPLKLNLLTPPHGFVRTPVLIEYHVENKSSQLIQLEVTLEASEGFMFAGCKQFLINILPESPKTLKFNLYPLVAGSVILPKFNLKFLNDSEEPLFKQDLLEQLIERCLPTHLFVVPQCRKKS